MNNKTSELFELLSNNLLKKDYSLLRFVDFDEKLEENESIERVYKTKRRIGVRTLCAVCDLPENISTVKELNNFFQQIRNSLSKKYVKFPYFKELGTFSVILCNNSNYEHLNKEINKLRDYTGWHMNTMLGAFLVNVDAFEFAETKTWGLITTGSQYELIKQALLSWCSENKKQTTYSR